MATQREIKPHNHLPETFWTFRNPVTTLTRQELRETLLWTDGWIIVAGRQRFIKSKLIGADIYRVTLGDADE